MCRKVEFSVIFRYVGILAQWFFSLACGLPRLSLQIIFTGNFKSYTLELSFLNLACLCFTSHVLVDLGFYLLQIILTNISL